MQRQWRRILFVMVVGALGFATRTARLRAFDQHRAGQHYEDVYYLPDAAWLPVLSLGFQQALADLIWCRSLVYFGEELGQRGQVKYVFTYTDAILALDPTFRSAYRWIATAAIYRPTAVSIESGMRAAGYLERAVARWPDDGELRWEYGSLLRFELAPLMQDKAEKHALLERAVPQLEAAARLGAGPPWLALNNAELLRKLGRTEQAIRRLEDLQATAQSEQDKRDIQAQLQRLRTTTYIEAMRTAEAQFERDHAESYPYLSAGLFLFVGHKPAQHEHEQVVQALFLDDSSHYLETE